jgi:hypothetical protein
MIRVVPVQEYCLEDSKCLKRLHLVTNERVVVQAITIYLLTHRTPTDFHFTIDIHI